MVYLGKTCEPDGFVPLRDGDRAASLRFRLGGEPNETPVIDRCLELAVETRNVATRDGGIVLAEFAAWQRRTKEPWVRMFVREELSFMRLPLLARAVAALLLKVCDERGVIDATADELAVWMGRGGKTRGERCNDRRVIRRAIAVLLEDGYLEVSDGALVIRNFVAAQNPAAPPQERHHRHAVAASPEPRRIADESPEDHQGGAVAASPEPRRIADESPEEHQWGSVAASPEPRRIADDGANARNHSDDAAASTVCTSSIQSTQSADPGRQSGEVFKLVSPTADDLAPKGKAKARGKAKAAPAVVPDAIPEAGTVAHNLYTAIVTDPKLRPIVRNPGEFSLKLVQAYGHIPAHRLVAQVHSAGLFLVTSPHYTDGNAFLRNQFTRLAETFAREPRPAEGPAATQRSSGPAGRAVAAG